VSIFYALYFALPPSLWRGGSSSTWKDQRPGGLG
jgi:hypothetical protein